jgi:hypothetical protein
MKINDKEISLRFGMLSVEIFLGEAAKDNGLSYYSSLQMARIIYAGMVNYYEVKQQKYPITFEEIYDFVESRMMSSEDNSELIEVINDFNNCQAIQKKKDALIEANDEIEEIKKKQTGIIQESQPMQPD